MSAAEPGVERVDRGVAGRRGRGRGRGRASGLGLGHGRGSGLPGVAFAAALGLALALLVPAGPHRAAAATAGRPALAPAYTPLGVPFLPSTTPMHITIGRLLAQQLSVQTGVTIRLADGSTVTTTKYTFTKLSLDSEMLMTQSVGGITVHLHVPSSGSLGGLDTAGKPETTVMWGNINNICVTVLFKICGVQGLLDFFGSFIPLTAGAQDFNGDIYAIQTVDDHAALSSTNNPVHLPGSLSVTTP